MFQKSWREIVTGLRADLSSEGHGCGGINSQHIPRQQNTEQGSGGSVVGRSGCRKTYYKVAFLDGRVGVARSGAGYESPELSGVVVLCTG